MIASDDFNRADGGLGANWTTSKFVAHPPQIASNQAVGGNALGGTSGAIYTAVTFGPDQYSKMVISAKGAGDFAPWVRAVSPGDTVSGYYAEWTSGSQVQIFKTTAQFLASASIGILNIGDAIELRVSGTTLSAYLNNTLVVQATDSDHATGQPGFEIDISTSAIDSWEGGDIGKNYLPRT